MVFCNEEYGVYEPLDLEGHNPYFSRWFSAIEILENNKKRVLVTILISRWFSAISNK